MNWQSAELLAQVDRFILQTGYGCQVELVAGDRPGLLCDVGKVLWEERVDSAHMSGCQKQ
jgi:UTP:GlnB (protein PII) uridylyltransferase